MMTNTGTPCIEHDVYCAIDESKLKDSIAPLAWSEKAEEILLAECDDFSDLDFWGEDIDGNAWRVLLRK